MNAEIKEQWLAALRSGKYKQGKDYLHSSDGRMCCLGVLADVGLDDEWILNRIEHAYGIGGSIYFWPPGKDDDPETGLTAGQARVLACMNDEGRSFAEIADYIEENL